MGDDLQGGLALSFTEFRHFLSNFHSHVVVNKTVPADAVLGDFPGYLRGLDYKLVEFVPPSFFDMCILKKVATTAVFDWQGYENTLLEWIEEGKAIEQGIPLQLSTFYSLQQYFFDLFETVPEPIYGDEHSKDLVNLESMRAFNNTAPSPQAAFVESAHSNATFDPIALRFKDTTDDCTQQPTVDTNHFTTVEEFLTIERLTFLERLRFRQLFHPDATPHHSMHFHISESKLQYGDITVRIPKYYHHKKSIFDIPPHLLNQLHESLGYLHSWVDDYKPSKNDSEGNAVVGSKGSHKIPHVAPVQTASLAITTTNNMRAKILLQGTVTEGRNGSAICSGGFSRVPTAIKEDPVDLHHLRRLCELATGSGIANNHTVRRILQYLYSVHERYLDLLETQREQTEKRKQLAEERHNRQAQQPTYGDEYWEFVDQTSPDKVKLKKASDNFKSFWKTPLDQPIGVTDRNKQGGGAGTILTIGAVVTTCLQLIWSKVTGSKIFMLRHPIGWMSLILSFMFSQFLNTDMVLEYLSKMWVKTTNWMEGAFIGPILHESIFKPGLGIFTPPDDYILRERLHRSEKRAEREKAAAKVENKPLQTDEEWERVLRAASTTPMQSEEELERPPQLHVREKLPSSVIGVARYSKQKHGMQSGVSRIFTHPSLPLPPCWCAQCKGFFSHDLRPLPQRPWKENIVSHTNEGVGTQLLSEGLDHATNQDFAPVAHHPFVSTTLDDNTVNSTTNKEGVGQQQPQPSPNMYPSATSRVWHSIPITTSSSTSLESLTHPVKLTWAQCDTSSSSSSITCGAEGDMNKVFSRRCTIIGGNMVSNRTTLRSSKRRGHPPPAVVADMTNLSASELQDSDLPKDEPAVQTIRKKRKRVVLKKRIKGKKSRGAASTPENEGSVTHPLRLTAFPVPQPPQPQSSQPLPPPTASSRNIQMLSSGGGSEDVGDTDDSTCSEAANSKSQQHSKPDTFVPLIPIPTLPQDNHTDASLPPRIMQPEGKLPQSVREAYNVPEKVFPHQHQVPPPPFPATSRCLMPANNASSSKCRVLPTLAEVLYTHHYKELIGYKGADLSLTLGLAPHIETAQDHFVT